MRIVFVSSGQYPEGGAATNRHLAYAKGLTELGHDVEFVLINRQKWPENIITIDKIRFYNCYVKYSGLNIPKINNALSLIKTIKKARITIKNIASENSNIRLVLLDASSFTLSPILSTAKNLGLKVFHERTEYPFVVSSKTLIGRFNLYIYLKCIVHKFDGIYVINKALERYFCNLTQDKIPLKIINMIVDPKRFGCKEKGENDNKFKMITYCGGLDGEKDGVPILIESFSQISDEFPSFRLQLIGSLANKKTRSNLTSLVNSLNIEGKVIFTGSMQRQEIPKALCNSSLLALARPSNKQAEGGFPTKLGEYLATGNPVVVTEVGEIGVFLKDKQNAYVAQPDSPEKFASKLREAILDNSSHEIALEGKKLVHSDFNYYTQAKELDKFFNNDL